MNANYFRANIGPLVEDALSHPEQPIPEADIASKVILFINNNNNYDDDYAIKTVDSTK